MTKIIFRDYDEFAAAISGLEGRFIPIARSEADWWIQRASIGRVAMQRVQVGGAATFAGDGAGSVISLAISLSDATPIRIDGDLLKSNAFVLLKQDQPFTFAARRATRWSNIVVPLDHAMLAPELLETLNTKVFRTRRSAQVLMQAPYITRVRLLASRLSDADENVGFRDITAERAAEEELMVATAQALEAGDPLPRRPVGRPRLSRGRVLGRALELIEARSGQPLLLEDLCQATHVSERTLRNVFHEYFNVGPMRLLKIRQLHEIRAALRAAEYGEQTVADIAARFGIWDFSSFARHYRALYDELPSHTLRAAMVAKDHASIVRKSWIRYAAQKFSTEDKRRHSKHHLSRNRT